MRIFTVSVGALALVLAVAVILEAAWVWLKGRRFDAAAQAGEEG